MTGCRLREPDGLVLVVDDVPEPFAARHLLLPLLHVLAVHHPCAEAALEGGLTIGPLSRVRSDLFPGHSSVPGGGGAYFLPALRSVARPEAEVPAAGRRRWRETALRSPVDPRQVFAVGLNYRAHAEESGLELPEVPATFTKFPGSLSGPLGDIPLSGPTVGWQVELVVVMGRHADRVPAEQAWDDVAGLAVGQDISDRTVHSQPVVSSASASRSVGSGQSGRGL